MAVDDIDLSDFDAQVVGPGRPLRVDDVLAQLDVQDPTSAAKLRAALAKPSVYNAPTIARTVRSWGLSLDSQAVARWRERNLHDD